MSLGRRSSLQLAALTREIVIGHVFRERGADLRAGFQVAQPGAFVLEAPDGSLGEDVVFPAAVTLHALLDAAPAQVDAEDARRVLRLLVAVEDLRTAEAGASLGKGDQAQFGTRRVRHPDADDQARVYVNDDGGMHHSVVGTQLGQIAGPKCGWAHPV